MKTTNLPTHNTVEQSKATPCCLCGRVIPEEDIVPNEKPVCILCEVEYEYDM